MRISHNSIFSVSVLILSFLFCFAPARTVFCTEIEKPRFLSERSFNPNWKYWTIPERDRVFYPDKVIELLDLKQGDVVADIGSGAGYFTFRLARAVGPKGMVYAVESNFQEAILGPLLAHAKDPRENPYDNIVAVANQQRTTGLEPGSVDLAFISLGGFCLNDPDYIVLSWMRTQFETHETLLRDIYRILKPGGRLALIDVISDSNKSIRNEYNALNDGFTVSAKDLDDVKDNYENIGFRLVQEFDIYQTLEHINNIKSFKRDMRNQDIGTVRRFLGRRMFFYIFEKPKGLRRLLHRKPEPSSFTIECDKASYNVGETINVRMILNNLPAPNMNPKTAFTGADSLYAEITDKADRPVRQIPLGVDPRSISRQPRGRRSPDIIETNIVLLHRQWQIEKRKWREPAARQVIYDGVGIKAGQTPEGSFLYCLEKIPGLYTLTVKYKMPIGAEVMYAPAGKKISVSPETERVITSNAVKIEILP